MTQGQLEISSTLAREAGVDELSEQREPFLEVMVMMVKSWCNDALFDLCGKYYCV